MLRDQFKDALKEAMRAKEQRTVSTVRLILAALKDKDIAARPSGNTEGIDDASILSMLQGMIKQRQESAELYEKGARQDLADQEREEIVIIERFLPKQMSAEDVTAAITAVIKDIGASNIKDMGKVMAELKARYAGQMDFSKASAAVKQALS